MKYLMCIFLFYCMHAFGISELSHVFSVETCSKKTYSDGHSVFAGEEYVLVYQAANLDCIKFTKKGEIEDGCDAKVISMVKAGEHGECPRTYFAVNPDDMPELKSKVGRFRLYVFDTRETYCGKTIVGLENNCYVYGFAPVTSLFTASIGNCGNAEIELNFIATILNLNADLPKISSVTMKNKKIIIHAKNTQKGMTYDIVNTRHDILNSIPENGIDDDIVVIEINRDFPKTFDVLNIVIHD